ncbi:zinc finger and BTB domain-containing protein 16-like [Cydia splendana]|uniref:zinc finger and BTB domain-containing protein 16-like n=1 Tax=Cydia splendana TaxID=1100963 RepID=UPI0028F49A76
MEAVVMKTEPSWDGAQPARPSDTHDSDPFCAVTESAPILEENMCTGVTPEPGVKPEPAAQLHAAYSRQEVTDPREDVNVKQEDTELGEDVKKEPGWEETDKLSGVGVSQRVEFKDDSEAGGSGMADPRGSEATDPCGSGTADTCEKETAQEEELDQELLVLRKERARSVKQQQAREHTDATSYACLMCTRTFKCLTTYKQHMTNMHTGEKPFACEWCDWRFDDLNDFKRHLRTHKGLRHFKWRAIYRKFTKLHKPL